MFGINYTRSRLAEPQIAQEYSMRLTNPYLSKPKLPFPRYYNDDYEKGKRKKGEK